METQQILHKINQAIQTLIVSENNILSRTLNERNLSDHLAGYLRPLFNEYHVDSEYNGDMDKPNDRKALAIAKNRLLEIGFQPNLDDTYKLSPDIIIHQRGTNDHNLVVIEVKKDVSSQRNKEFDLIKLEHLTINYMGNHYNYKLGIALILSTGEDTGTSEMHFFQNGLPKTEQTLE
jgi:hypothetical protein